MEAQKINSKIRQSVSIITITNRQDYTKNLFLNYSRQRHAKKELIVIVNDNSIPLASYQNRAKKLLNVKVFRLPEHYSLGACLNFAIKKTKYDYIAKFDDDDYYAPYYLTDCLMVFKRTNADIIGKRAHYMFLRGSNTLILRFPQDENRYVSVLPGATLVFKRKVFSKVRFPNQSVGEDDTFCRRSNKQGYKIYSAGKYNFVAIRRRNSYKHTWIISDKKLIAHHQRIPEVQDFKRFVSRKPKGIKT
ncbi:MAG: glycosyltransferase [Gorillibacterium sp.]|nr:glycosyltransferase [Gorillibacterium sp.]